MTPWPPAPNKLQRTNQKYMWETLIANRDTEQYFMLFVPSVACHYGGKIFSWLDGTVLLRILCSLYLFLLRMC